MDLVDLNDIQLPYDVDIEELRNAPEYGIIRDAIREIGLLLPILVDSDNVVIDGRKRYLIYKELNLSPIPVAHNHSEVSDYIKSKINDEMKRKIIRFIKERGLSYRQAARLFSIPKSTLFDWSKMFDPSIDSLSLLQYLSREPKPIFELADTLKLPTSKLTSLLDDLISMGFKINIEDGKVSLENPITDEWISYLNEPRTTSDLSQYFRVPENIIPHIIEAKRKEGWDIRNGIINNEEVYFFGGTQTRSDIPNIHNKVELPLAIISDIHIGSKWFDQSALEQAFKMIERDNIYHILMPGDIIQGVNVYRRESLDLSIMNLDDQIKLAVDLFASLIPPNRILHVIMGNHEDAVKAKTKSGIDPLLYLLRQLRVRRPDLTINYYGHDALLVISNLIKKHEVLLNPDNPQYIPFESPASLYMIHGEGRGAYAVSYPAQKIARAIRIPVDILVIGHYHKLANFRAEGKELILSGTFQGRNHFFTGVGADFQKGFVIIKGLPENSDKYTSYVINTIAFE